MKSVYRWIALLLLLACFGYLILNPPSKEELMGYLFTARAIINSYGVMAPVIFITIYSLLIITCVPGAFILFPLLGGLLFGVVYGSIYCSLGALLGATTAFLLARYLLGDWIIKHTSTKLKNLVDRLQQNDWYVVTFVRSIPVVLVPFFIQNYLLGLTRVHLLPYIAVTALFILPRIVIAGYVGSLGEVFLLGEEGLYLTQKWGFLATMLLTLMLLIIIAGKLIAKKFKKEMRTIKQ